MGVLCSVAPRCGSFGNVLLRTGSREGGGGGRLRFPIKCIQMPSDFPLHSPDRRTYIHIITLLCTCRLMAAAAAHLSVAD
ncbi:hypothetical protein CesoFtcFv8_014672 [Champsocephalus esox]|uniref:Uncharacterized protein n=2 Tax=Champsocephalus TaxID=52236 RepID=A0AAN8HKH4_CHAGU|nr:hypothetical protein CesoFtcFv8_014672 [Champsocephalus esox]KAK5919101.1 hypothetical protein CgunFtcFv8_023024 [Champsocephalus gunnari]